MIRIPANLCHVIPLLSIETRSCETDQFRCKNGRCLPIDYRCDGDNDCDDNSDESPIAQCRKLTVTYFNHLLWFVDEERHLNIYHT